MSSIEVISGRPVARLRSGGSLLRSLLDRLVLWNRVRRTRLHLLELGEHELEDLGLTRAAAHEEAMRPFWDMGTRREGRS